MVRFGKSGLQGRPRGDPNAWKHCMYACPAVLTRLAQADSFSWDNIAPPQCKPHPYDVTTLGAKFNKRCDRLKYQINFIVQINPIVFTAKSTVLGIRFLSNQSQAFLYGSHLYRGWALPLIIMVFITTPPRRQRQSVPWRGHLLPSPPRRPQTLGPGRRGG